MRTELQELGAEVLCLGGKDSFDHYNATITMKLTIRYRVWYGGKEAENMSHTIKNKQDLILRAKRIQGQVEALVRALTEERECSDVLQLLSAARGAVNSLMAELLEGHIKSHVLNGRHKPTSEQLEAADEVIAMVKSYLK
jgi:DNA-binding FrmR family transcriptional regulator